MLCYSTVQFMQDVISRSSGTAVLGGMENRCEKDDDGSHSPCVFGFVYVGDVASCCLYDVVAAS